MRTHNINYILKPTALGLFWMLSIVVIFQWARPVTKAPVVANKPTVPAASSKPPRKDAEAKFLAGELSELPHPMANVSFDYPCKRRRFDEHWQQAMLKVMAMEESDHTYVIISDLAESLGPEDINAAVDWAWLQKDQNEVPFLHLLWRWGELDPVAALAYINGVVTDRKLLKKCNFALASGALIGNPLMALSLKDASGAALITDANSVISKAIDLSFQKNPQALIDATSTMPDEPRKQMKTRLIREMLENGDYMKCLALASSEEQEFQNVERERILNEWADKDPRAAMRWLNQNPEMPNRTALEATVEKVWCMSDPTAYFSKYRDIPSALVKDPDFDDTYIGRSSTSSKLIAFREWMTNYPVEATAWLATIQESPQKEALFTFCHLGGGRIDIIRDQDQYATIRILNSIHDSRVRSAAAQGFLAYQLIEYGTVSQFLPNFPELSTDLRNEFLQIEASGHPHESEILFRMDGEVFGIFKAIILGQALPNPSDNHPNQP